MKQLRKAFLSTSFLLLFLLQSLFVSVPEAQAAELCSGGMTGVNTVIPRYESGSSHTVTFNTSNWSKEYTYFIVIVSEQGRVNALNNKEGVSQEFRIDSDGDTPDNDGQIDVKVQGSTLTATIKNEKALTNREWAAYEDTHYIQVHRFRGVRVGSVANYFCHGAYKTSIHIAGCTTTISQLRDVASTGTTSLCYYGGENSCIQNSTANPVTVRVSGLKYTDGDPVDNQEVSFNFIQPTLAGDLRAIDQWATVRSGTAEATFRPDVNGTYRFRLLLRRGGTNYAIPGCSRNIVVKDTCGNSCNTEEVTVDTTADIASASVFEICAQISNDTLRGKCEDCAGGPSGQAGVWTAVGCIERTPQSIVQRFIEIGLGLGGGICLLMTLVGGFMITTSQGEMKQVNEAKEMITSAIVGLLFIIFSVFILQFIGVTIFQIPGFGSA